MCSSEYQITEYEKLIVVWIIQRFDKVLFGSDNRSSRVIIIHRKLKHLGIQIRLFIKLRAG